MDDKLPVKTVKIASFQICTHMVVEVLSNEVMTLFSAYIFMPLQQ